MVENTVQRSSPHYCGQESCCSAFNAVVVAFPKIFVSLSPPYAPKVYLRCWNLLEDYPSQVNAYLNDICQVRGGWPSRTTAFDSSLHDHSLWGISSHLFLLGRIPISKWGLRPNTKAQTFAPTVYIIIMFLYKFISFYR